MELKHVAVDPSRLNDIPALERALGGKFIGAEMRGSRAVVEILPVTDLRFWVDVRNLKGEIYLEYGGHTEPLDEIMESYDRDLAQELIAQVVEGDNGGALNMSGMYFPTSQKSIALFEQLMQSAKPKVKGIAAG